MPFELVFLFSEHSRLMKTKHQEWFFFTTPPEKHGKRENNKGYWIQKGEDKKIKRGDNQLIGMVKRLLFNRGCAPNGQRTYWVIREYRLVDDGHGLKVFVLFELFLDIITLLYLMTLQFIGACRQMRTCCAECPTTKAPARPEET